MRMRSLHLEHSWHVLQLALRWLTHLGLGFVLSLCASHAAFALDINQANEAELDSLKGMGPALSAKVLQARAQGPFKSWHDLMQRVSGLRKGKAQQFSEQGLTVQGETFTQRTQP